MFELIRVYQLECVAGRKQGRSEREGNQKRGQSFEEKENDRIKQTDKDPGQEMARKRQTKRRLEGVLFSPKAEPGIERAASEGRRSESERKRGS